MDGSPRFGLLLGRAARPSLSFTTTQPHQAWRISPHFSRWVRAFGSIRISSITICSCSITLPSSNFSGSKAYSFNRWTADFGHVFPLYGKTPPGPRAFNGPDQCAAAVGAKCPPISYSMNRQGAIGIRFLLTESIANAGSTVPFYFQPTLGGSDINGTSMLASYDDYRFRAPNAFLIRESFEHSIWGPFGFDFMADQGKVALTRGAVNFSNLDYSYAAGITIRAGGMPLVDSLFAWGSGSTQHNIVSVDTSFVRRYCETIAVLGAATQDRVGERHRNTSDSDFKKNIVHLAIVSKVGDSGVEGIGVRIRSVRTA